MSVRACVREPSLLANTIMPQLMLFEGLFVFFVGGGVFVFCSFLFSFGGEGVVIFVVFFLCFCYFVVVVSSDNVLNCV